jgi:hypothetical protein
MRRRYSGFYLAGICALAAATATSPAVGQTPAPTPAGCNIPLSNISTASVVHATGESLQHKRWQPHGGVIQFTIKSFAPIPDKASFFVCFRWKTAQNKGVYEERRPDRLDRNNDGTSWTVTTTIPYQLKPAPADSAVEMALPLVPFVPLADVRIISVNEDRTTLAADVTSTIGITYPWAGIVLALATVIIACVALTVIANLRLEHPGIRKSFWFLRIISTPTGYASLSQLQIMLWTLVVAASAVYVMALSGDLIEVTIGTLVLLGIAGAAALGAKIHNQSQSSAAQAAAAAERQKADDATIEAAGKVEAAKTASVVATVEKNIAAKAADDASTIADAAQTRADAFKKPPPGQTPRWSDLIVNESTNVDGSVTREIDVARFQMLLFTIITAVFVLLSVITTYVIPEIPTGFLTLMGISNGVYLGSKVAQTT